MTYLKKLGGVPHQLWDLNITNFLCGLSSLTASNMTSQSELKLAVIGCISKGILNVACWETLYSME